MLLVQADRPPVEDLVVQGAECQAVLGDVRPTGGMLNEALERLEKVDPDRLQSQVLVVVLLQVLGRRITRADDEMMELSNGCICCAMKDDLLTTLLRLVTGVIRAVTGNAFGIAGVAPQAETVAIPICTPSGASASDTCRLYDTLRGLDAVWDQGAGVANLAVVGSFSVNGVAALHTQLLKERVDRVIAGLGEQSDLEYLESLAETVKTASR